MTLKLVEETITFDQVRDWVLGSLEFTGACPVSDEVIEVLLRNCLGQVYSQVWDHKHYQHIWKFDVPAGECNVLIQDCDENGDPIFDAEGSPVLVNATTDQIFDPLWRIINKLQRDSDCKELYEADCYPSKCEPQDVPGQEAMEYPAKEELVTKWQDRGKIKEVVHSTEVTYEVLQKRNGQRCEWFCWGDEFLVSPASTTDQSYTMYGYRKLQTTLKVVSEDDPNKTIWQLVDLPPEFLTAYQKCVLGFMHLQCGDQVNAREWLRIASDEINEILNLNDGENMDRTPVDENLGCVMNGGRVQPFCPPMRYHFEDLDGDLQRGRW